MSTYGQKTLYRTKVTDIKTNAQGDVEGVGTIRWEGEKCYRWVQNYHTTALVAGEPVCYDPATNLANKYERVIQPTTATLKYFAGVAMGAIAADSTGSAGDGGFGWIQIEGYHSSVVVSIGKTSIAAGINFYPANTVDYLVGAGLNTANITVATNTSTIDPNQGDLRPYFVARASIASSSASGAGTAAGTTAIAGSLHCLRV